MIVNTVWIGEKLPLLQKVCLRSWVAHYNEVHLWAYSKLFRGVKGIVHRDAREIMPLPIVRYRTGSPVLHAELFRYRFLHEVGGIFIDTDTICLDHFDLTKRFVVSSEQQNDSPHPNFAFVNFPKATANSFALACRVTAERRLQRYVTAPPNQFGPKLLKEQVDLARPRVTVLKPEAFCKLGWKEAARILSPNPPDLNGAIGLHLWNAVLEQSEYKLDREWPASCLWETWKREYA